MHTARPFILVCLIAAGAVTESDALGSAFTTQATVTCAIQLGEGRVSPTWNGNLVAVTGALAYAIAFCDLRLPQPATATRFILYGCDNDAASGRQVFVGLYEKPYSSETVTERGWLETWDLPGSGCGHWIVDFADFPVDTRNNSYFFYMQIPTRSGSSVRIETWNIELETL